MLIGGLFVVHNEVGLGRDEEDYHPCSSNLTNHLIGKQLLEIRVLWHPPHPRSGAAIRGEFSPHLERMPDRREPKRSPSASGTCGFGRNRSV